jgi:ribosomal protein S28E/S33
MWAIYNPQTGFSEILLNSRREARELSFPEDNEKVLAVAILPEKAEAAYLPVVGWAVLGHGETPKDCVDVPMLEGRHKARVLAKQTGGIVHKVVLA